MLSFELSAIDLILAIAVFILLVLYLTKLSAKPVGEEKPSVQQRIPASVAEKLEEKVRRLETEQETGLPTRSEGKCPYRFGYLKKLGKNPVIPEECLSCPRITECLYSAE